MRRILVSLVFLCALALVHCQAVWADVFNMPAGQTSLATVPVGNPGNANDPTPLGSLYGGVAYNYKIGKYDVTIGQYTAFLNAVAATDTYGLYSPGMATDLNIAGIARSGSSGSYSYSVIGSANHPIAYVTWGDAARFSNWLNNGQPTGGETLSTTEDGAYFLNGATSDTALNAVTRKASATWFLPTENEWYKAAYYNPATSSYYNYPFSSDTAPTSAPPGSAPNTGNFRSGDSNSGAFAVTGTSSFSSSQNYLTDVGAYTASVSPYGAFDMGGDVYEWTEKLDGDSYRVLRGGAWGTFFSTLGFLNRYDRLPTDDSDIAYFGFRVASVPEPSTFVLAVFAVALLVLPNTSVGRRVAGRAWHPIHGDNFA